MKKLAILFILSTLVLSCQKDTEFDNKIEGAAFDDALQGLGYLSEVDGYPMEEINEPQELEVVEEPAREEGTDMECSVKRYKAAPGYNELFLMDPTSDVIFPGAIIKGESIVTGEYTPILAPRKPITLSISLNNLDGDISRVVENPKLSTVRREINEILSSDVTGSTPAKVNFEITDVYSESQLNLAIGANYQNPTTNISGSFEFSQENVSSRVIVKFLQVYYTIDMDVPEHPSDLFQSMPETETFGSVSPMYVSTVSYGRMVLFSATSSRTSTELKSALDAAFSSGVQNGEINISASHKSVIEESSIKAYVIGGSGADAAGVVNGIEGLRNYITQGGDYSKDSPGAMLSYKLRFLKDNSIGKILLASEYNVRQCEQAYFRYEAICDRVRCIKCEDWGSDVEISGSMGAQRSQSPNQKATWSISGDINKDGGILSVGKKQIFEFYKPDINKDYIRIFGNLKEWDGGGSSQSVGSEAENIVLSDILSSPNYTLEFSRGNLTLESNWRLNPK